MSTSTLTPIFRIRHVAVSGRAARSTAPFPVASVLGGLALGAACGVLAAAFGNVISSSAVGAELTVVIASALGGCFAWQG